jgi:hypothetical protein
MHALIDFLFRFLIGAQLAALSVFLKYTGFRFFQRSGIIKIKTASGSAA